MRNPSLRPTAYVILLLIVALFARNSAGFEVETHAAMSRKALEATEPMEFWQGYTVDDLLSDIYELPQGAGTTIGGQTLREWLGQGSQDEDNFADDFSLYNPLTWRLTGRFLNHFHDPTCAWDQAGLGERYNVPGASDGKSALLWAQDPDQSGVVGSADPRSWQDARAWFAKALTLPEKADRDEAWKETFTTLGHQIHLIQDLASPAHTRNDPHLIRDVFHRWAKTSSGAQAVASVSPAQARGSHTHEPMSAVDHQNDLEEYSLKVTCSWHGTDGSSGNVTVAQDQGGMSGGSMSIPGITFPVPQEETFFQCCTRITVYDSQGSQGGPYWCEPISG